MDLAYQEAERRILQAMMTGAWELSLNELGLKTVPCEIGKLASLQQLNLAYNELVELPPEIGMLTNLQILNLRFNHLKKLPREIGNLTNLQQLDLYANELSELCGEMSKLQSLNGNHSHEELAHHSSYWRVEAQWGLDLRNNNFSIPEEVYNWKDSSKIVEYISDNQETRHQQTKQKQANARIEILPPPPSTPV